MKPKIILVFLVIVLTGWISFFQIFSRLEYAYAQKSLALQSIIERSSRLSTDTIIGNHKSLSLLISEIEKNVIKQFILEGFESSNNNNNLIIVTDERASIFYLQLIRTSLQNCLKISYGANATSLFFVFRDFKKNNFKTS